MTSESTKKEGVVSAEEAMATFGIRCVPVDYFYYRNYRYTNLKDAIAQAERDKLPPIESSVPLTSQQCTTTHVARHRSSSV